jgi:CRISPR/Cas system-associated protein Cas5 (RAMP superfamily)
MNQANEEKRSVGRPRLFADHVLTPTENARRVRAKIKRIGHKLNVVSIENAEPGFIRITTERPAMVYKATADQAANIVTELTAAIKNAARPGATA